MTDQPRVVDFNVAARERLNILDSLKQPTFRTNYRVYHTWCNTFPLNEWELKENDYQAYSEMALRFYQEHFNEKARPIIQEACALDLAITQLTLEQGEAYFVPQEILMPILESSRTLDQHTWIESDFPTPAGFIWFEKVCWINALPVRGIGWIKHPDKDRSFAMTVFGPLGGPKTKVPLNSPLYLTAFEFNSELKEEHVVQDWLKLSRVYLKDFQYDEEHCGALPNSIYRVAQGLAALLIFMNQRIVIHTEERASRTERKRAERSNISKDTVRLVHLRRAERPPQSKTDSERTQIEHDHSWLVRGFWKQQPWGPNRVYRRTIYIAPHVRGPKDKPLKSSERIFAVSR